jgi:uncharacterized coiled-coil protein SlyX
MNTTILSRNCVCFFALLLIGCLELLPKAEAVNPPPDGGYPGGNTAEGQNALLNLTTGAYNTAVGLFSLESNTTGNFNTAIGAGTLPANIAFNNTAVGAGALLSNTTGFGNTANGAFALFNDTTGQVNTATGVEALLNNTTGANNTADGVDALENSTRDNNTAVGISALRSLTTGTSNTALGSGAGINVTTADQVICIGTNGVNVSNACFIGSIRGVTTQNADAIPVVIDSFGQLGTVSSSRRFKDEIRPMDNASESILALKPVTFHYKTDAKGIPQFGLIAEEVAKVNPDLVVCDANGEIYTVRYDAVNAMLLTEFLKEHRTVQELKSIVAKQEASAEQQQKQIEALTLGLQKVSAQLEASKPASQVVVNNQ